ncbi:amino acid ABC transporter permease [Ornithinimicrobium cavernae]|uniref:amino acid ABC transporter permease n=1 Tax=Ornithinimicrobium cavernae TaxID=2666047 RepID=UPI000D694751|nr:amino acid ABC transporter permease [Ornithinimicrobium cavernae]
MSTLLYDEPGPVTRARLRSWSVVALLVIGLAVGLVCWRLWGQGQFEEDLWAPFLDEPALRTGLVGGLVGTLQAAAMAMALALVVGFAVAVARLSPSRVVQAAGATFVWFFRGPPLLILILFFFLAFPMAFDIDITPFWALVLGLMLYNGAVLAEVIRAGVLALPRGQEEAAVALGMRRGTTLRYVLLPQAVRNMLPAVISQMVILVKDTSLGFVVSYGELLRYGNTAIQVLDNPIQMYLVVALIFIAINMSLSRVAHALEKNPVASGLRRRRTVAESR